MAAPAIPAGAAPPSATMQEPPLLTADSLTPEELLRLHSLVTSTFAERMTRAALSGSICVWCDAPAPTGPRLEYVEMDGVDPRGCTACYSARMSYVLTWDNWFHHVLGCRACEQGTVCHVGRGRRVEHERTLAAVERAMYCHRCNQRVQGDERVNAQMWEGTSAWHIGYAHTACPAESGD